MTSVEVAKGLFVGEKVNILPIVRGELVQRGIEPDGIFASAEDGMRSLKELEKRKQKMEIVILGDILGTESAVNDFLRAVTERNPRVAIASYGSWTLDCVGGQKLVFPKEKNKSSEVLVPRRCNLGSMGVDGAIYWLFRVRNGKVERTGKTGPLNSKKGLLGFFV